MHGDDSATILVVDDNPANLIAIETALGELGASIVRANSGGEALRLLLERDFALVLLDVKMPTMDGFETARLIRERKRSRHLPIIFVTAYGRDDSEASAAYALGAVDFLFKPIVPEVLRAKASVFVELHMRAAEVDRQAEQIREHEQREHRRRLEEERSRWEAATLLKQMAQLAEADRHKDRFVALLSHELRNPLVPIMAGLELLRERFEDADGTVDDSMRRTRAILDKQIHHLVRLVDDLLDTSRVGSAKIELRNAPLTLQDVVEQAVVTSQPVIDSCHHQLRVEVPEEPLWLMGDSVRLVQVIANLLNNAARYTPSGGTIEIHAKQRDAHAEVAVIDNGRGIGSEFLGRAFEAFSQEGQPGGGLGLGLSLVRQLVMMHDGEVTAHSAGPGLGSEFTVRLPLMAAPPPVASLNGASVHPQSNGDRPKSIVLIDDNEDIRELMASLLRTWGHTVQVAPDGESGVELVQRAQPDVAFIDIGLPGMDGYRVAEQLRARQRRDPLRLVAMTGFGRETDRRRALDAGFDLHIAKPATIEALKQALSFDSVHAR